ncbi:MAG TPA: SDR family oxidoreductase [Acidobacteriaceae bacterium]|jgi:NAD(P)-dependent dehydrogenase (short-subunit alcohol dehydrogenase family)|nr:SDR family oxidoreductase [Acidobacteriaceae bacterium]
MAETKVALISGANKGIGLETARQLGKKGYTILLGARDLSRGQAAVDELKADGVQARAVKLDVTSAADIAAAAKLIDSEYGGKLDALINNAGVNFDTTWGKQGVAGTSLDELQKTFETNLFAVHALTLALLPALKKAPAARIVNLSSILGSLTLHATPGSPIYEMKTLAYNVSKAALNMYTIHLAHELRDTKIKVNSAHPGWVKTDLGGDAAPMEVPDGAKTSVALATLGEDGPTGKYIHLGETLPW